MKWKWIALTLVLLALPYSLAFSHDEPAARTDGPGTYLLLGAEYDNEVGFSQTIGVSQRLYKSLWLIPRGTFDREGSAEADVVYWVNEYLGLIAGPGIDWSNPANADHISYGFGASGIVVHWQINPEVGIGGGARYNYSLQGDDYFIDGWKISFMVTGALGSLF